MPFDWLVGFPPFEDSLIQLDVNDQSELWDWRHVCWQLPDSTQAPRLCHTVLTDSISLLDWTIAKHFHGDHVISRGGQDCALMQDGPIRTLDPRRPVAQEQESVYTNTHTHTHTHTNNSTDENCAIFLCSSVLLLLSVMYDVRLFLCLDLDAFR